MKLKTKVAPSHISESDLEIQLSAYFEASGSDNHVRRQVYYGGKRIDIVIQRDTITSSFEVKLTDWKGALKQAQLNKTACEYSYVALWTQKAAVAIDNIHEFTSRKIGLILVDKDSEPIFMFSPTKDKCFSSIANAQLRLEKV
jgi:hypothetical protein